MDFIGLIRNSGAPLESITRWWNQVASWVSSTILNEGTAKRQVKHLRTFLRVAEHCLELRNYNTCAQLISGIKHHSVSRLRGLQELINQKISKRIDKIEQIISPHDNYHNYRAIPKKRPFLPFLAVHQRDIRSLCDNNPTFLDSDGQLINAERLVMLGICFSTMGLDYPTETFDYAIEKDKKMQEYLTHLKTVPEDGLFTLSFYSEPNRGGEQVPTIRDKVVRKRTNPLHNSTKLQEHYLDSAKQRPRRKRSVSDSNALESTSDKYLRSDCTTVRSGIILQTDEVTTGNKYNFSGRIRKKRGESLSRKTELHHSDILVRTNAKKSPAWKKKIRKSLGLDL